MGTSTSAAQVADKLMLAARALDRGKRRVVQRAAEDVAGIYERQFAADGLRRGQGLAGKPWRGVKSNVWGSANAVGKVWASPPAHLFNNPTKAHLVAPTAFGKTRRGRLAAARRGRLGQVVRSDMPRAIIPGGSPRAIAKHPGTRGSRSWQKATPKARRRFGEIGRRQIVNELNPIFR